MRIGIMGGTFDPIHNGHLLAAEEVREQLNLDKIIFMPAGVSPLKRDDVRAEARFRYEMCLLATAENPHFSVSPIEINREGTSYTVDTLLQLRQIYPCESHEIFFIVGADVPEKFHKWKDMQKILQLCTIVATTRPGHKTLDAVNFPLLQIEITDIAISSTDIRNRLADGKSVRYMLPNSVCEYIAKEGLYFGTFAKIKTRLELELSRPRFLHSLAVVEEAEKIGNFYAQDAATIKKLRLAALLHDCAKDGHVGVKHAEAGAIVAKNEYSVADADVLSAIESHTLGKPNMSFIDKAVYLADFIEPTREYEAVRHEARRLAYENLDAAMIYVLRHEIAKNEAKGNAVFAASREALKYMEEKHGE